MIPSARFRTSGCGNCVAVTFRQRSNAPAARARLAGHAGDDRHVSVPIASVRGLALLPLREGPGTPSVARTYVCMHSCKQSRSITLIIFSHVPLALVLPSALRCCASPVSPAFATLRLPNLTTSRSLYYSIQQHGVLNPCTGGGMRPRGPQDASPPLRASPTVPC